MRFVVGLTIAILTCGCGVYGVTPPVSSDVYGEHGSIVLQSDDSPASRIHAAEPNQQTTEAAREFFESRIQPVLTEHCVSCHGPRRQRAGLRLDARIDLLRGGDRGPVVLLGNPDESELIRAIRYDDAIQMPPMGKLSEQAITALTDWVKMGAPWPESKPVSPKPVGTDSIAEVRKTHWAFQPVRKPAIPAVRDANWLTSPIDNFILEKIEAQGLSPAKLADRRTLIRRVTFDLIGLPPTPDEVDAFLNDSAPDAFATVVDRLLASPHYGERWGRYWLDVARYADTKGYVYDGEERRYPFAHTYRDYVIRTFNDDLPYDRFLIEQIAADCLPSSSGDRRSLAAMGFLTLGRRFVNNMHDVIDDRLDVIFRGTQALTISCARCHDHKFDPIPTRDYYSLYGVMANSTETTVQFGPADSSSKTKSYEAELHRRAESLNRAFEAARQKLSERLRGRVTDYLIAVLDAAKQPGDDFYVILSPDDINPVVVRRWQSYLARTRNGYHRIFGAWHAFAAIRNAEFAARAPIIAQELVAAAAKNPVIPIRLKSNRTTVPPRMNPIVARALLDSPPKSMQDVAERYGKLFEGVHRAWQDCVQASVRSNSALPKALPDAALEELRQVLYEPEGPTTVPRVRINEIESLFDENTRVTLNQAQAEIDRLNLDSLEAPPCALILQDSPLPYQATVFTQGNPKIKGEEVPRQFLEVLAGESRRPFQNGSGRRELAEAIASTENPLTARVMVNRVWLHHFGAALVGSPSNFGLNGDAPTHPELLDYLAWKFMEDGWSIKKLHRLMLLSSTYQQSSEYNRRHAKKDPENQLFARMNRQRLDFEAMRDSLLSVAGRLDTQFGGRPVQLNGGLQSNRRTIYGFIDRQNLPDVLASFDFANPDQHCASRHRTTVPQQALFLLNSPFVMEQAQALAARVDCAAPSDLAEWICQIYSIVYQRQPTQNELRNALRFLASVPSTSKTVGDGRYALLSTGQRYAQALLVANEFVFID